jgi:hypothetical protein
LKKVTHNSLTFKLLNTLAWVNIPIKLTYVCKLLSKNILRNISYMRTKHKKFTTFSMYKYIYNMLPY